MIRKDTRLLLLTYQLDKLLRIVRCMDEETHGPESIPKWWTRTTGIALEEEYERRLEELPKLSLFGPGITTYRPQP